MNLPVEISTISERRSRAVASMARPLERRRLQFYLGLLLADGAALLGSFAAAALIYAEARDAILLSAQLLLPVFLTIALYNRSYSLDSLRDWKTAAQRVLTALLISAVLLNFIAFFAKMNAKFSRLGFVIGFLLCVGLLLGIRWLARFAAHRIWGPNPLNMLIIDDGGPDVPLNDTYRISAAEYGLEPNLDNPHALDKLARLVTNMDEVIVTCPQEKRVQWAMALKGTGVHAEVNSDYMNEIGALGVVRREKGGFATLLVATGPLGMRARFLKRAFDFAVAALALVVAAPILLIAALLIKLEDGGPVLFRQRRIGRRNQLFSIFKLRTMAVGGSDADGKESTSKDDVRVTRIGRILRKTSIDELPQLLNVLRGEMSLVGPRPHAIGSLAGEKLFWEVDHRYWHRHSLRPGLTGLAQVRGLRGATHREADLSSRLQADLEYLAGWSLWRDIGILLQTARVLVHDRAF